MSGACHGPGLITIMMWDSAGGGIQQAVNKMPDQHITVPWAIVRTDIISADTMNCKPAKFYLPYYN